MSVLIPHVTSQSGARLASRIYSDSDCFRLPIDRAEVLSSLLPVHADLWVDTCIDGCRDISTVVNKDWLDYMNAIPGFSDVFTSSGIARPNQARVNEFVNALLDECLQLEPVWITVPQLPVVNDSSHNKINRSLAQASALWRRNTDYEGSFILPLIFTHQRQLNQKTARNPKVTQAERCFRESRAEGYWVVDSSLDDETGSKALREKRFTGIIDFHTEINEKIQPKIRCAGPYWGLNLVLWVRGLIDYPLIGIGSGYQYHLSGGLPSRATARIAIPSLRRRARVEATLSTWLDNAMSKLGRLHPVYEELSILRRRFTALSDVKRSKSQVAEFYRDWFDQISNAPPGGQAMALFQDLATAYALGRPLGELKGEGATRRPESISEVLMMKCL